MTNRPYFPAYPATDPNGQQYSGLTVREHFAAMAMQGILTNPNRPANPKEVAEAAMWFADALLRELEK